MSRSRGLGKGLGALLPDLNSVKDVDVRFVPIDRIKNSLYQPRKQYPAEDLEELANSIKQHGVLQPIILRPAGDMFEIVAGERRWRAAIMAGLKEIPAVVRQLDPKSVIGVALVENIQREDLNPIEEAEAFRKLIDEFGLSHESIAGTVGKSRSYVTNMLRLLKLPEEVRKFLIDGKMSMGHARALLSIEDKEKLISVAKKVVERGLSVRQTETIAKNTTSLNVRKPKMSWKRTKKEKKVEQELKGILGSDVKVYKGQDGVKVELVFTGDKDLARLISLIKKFWAQGG